ncbi:hypothetical protein HG537_0F05180 [Torulaspora globosa]|uniref:CCHC-type domain-containing protein n=1 Tax=Torulaspora globosa TaxID=48254 RepID=A0A7H9HYU1_9SACH|nr:hypothetical protein HG537_0F05180 [Torulaspora sp. CBS 2947]
MSSQYIPNASEPLEFSGYGEPLAIANFLTRMDQHLQFEFSDDYDKILYFAECLTDGAAVWFAELSEESLRHSTFDDFMKQFKRRYYNEHQIDSILTQLRYCIHRESLEAYNNEFNALAAAIPDTLVSPKCKLSFYLSGLRKPLQITVKYQRPDSLKSAMILASNSCWEDHSVKSDDLHSQMEIDTIRTGYNRRRTDSSNTRKARLTEEERKFLRKLGICFRCRDGKHMAKDCPLASST